MQQVQRYDNCTSCLGRNHNKTYHKNTNPGQKPLVCGLYDETSGSYCNSLEHAAFHGSTSHKKETQTWKTLEKEKQRNSSNRVENDRLRSSNLEERLKEREGVQKCHRCNDTHPNGHHTRSYVDSKKAKLHPDSDQAALEHDAQALQNT